jgi:hypothetical protein
MLQHGTAFSPRPFAWGRIYRCAGDAGSYPLIPKASWGWGNRAGHAAQGCGNDHTSLAQLSRVTMEKRQTLVASACRRMLGYIGRLRLEAAGDTTTLR